MSAARKTLMMIMGLSIGGFCFWLAAGDVQWRNASRIFREADVGWIGLGVVFFAGGMIMRTARWQQILSFRAPVDLGITGLALLGGYALNSALPARLGELFRADYLARLSGLSRSGILASIVVERLLDLLAAICLLALGLGLVGGGDDATRSILVASIVVAGIVTLVLLTLVVQLSPCNAEAAVTRLISWLPFGDAMARLLGPRLGDFTQLLRVMRTRQFALAALTTFPIWMIETAAVWTMCRAVHVELGLGQILCLMGGSSLSTLLPTAPAYVGSYQFAYVLLLAEFGIDATRAIVAATTTQIYLIGLFSLLGFISIGLNAAGALKMCVGAQKVR